MVHSPTAESLSAAFNHHGQVELRAVFDETRNGGQTIAAAEYYVDAPPWRGGVANPMIASDGGFDSLTEEAAAAINSASVRSLFFVRAKDQNGSWGAVRAAFAARQTAGGQSRARISRPAPRRSVQQ
jgi:hypothetical protein